MKTIHLAPGIDMGLEALIDSSIMPVPTSKGEA